MEMQRLLEDAVGEWVGEYRLWFRPQVEPDAQSESHATVTSELRGSGLLLRYDWRYEADLQEGLAIIGRTDGGGLQMGWSDTFHYKDGVMHNDAVGTTAVVLGHYGPTEAPWGWRTEFAMPSREELEIRAFNILPDGQEALATEARYRRAG
ncbi:MAG: hypothetical protein JWM25_237 [Thermoleophilia bacterium]|nr:hypothetical protein [Thermoleophilia bacterium]MCZ4495654.1 hypothetical protein [Thermoleophilia bacterium]